MTAELEVIARRLKVLEAAFGKTFGVDAVGVVLGRSRSYLMERKFLLPNFGVRSGKEYRWPMEQILDWCDGGEAEIERRWLSVPTMQKVEIVKTWNMKKKTLPESQ